jgi:hypothetical protein
MASGRGERPTHTSTLASRRSGLAGTAPIAGRALPRPPVLATERARIARGVPPKKQDATSTVGPLRPPAGLAAKVTELLPQNAQAAAEQAWLDDLGSLWGNAKQRFPDIAWSTRPPAADAAEENAGGAVHRLVAGNHEELYAHTGPYFSQRRQCASAPATDPNASDPLAS